MTETDPGDDDSLMQQGPAGLHGKLALVTGAGMGIGQGVALELGRRGADVVLHYASSAQRAEESAAQLRAMGRRAVTVQGDLSKVSECRRVVDEAVKFLGGLDVLVNNAGVTLTGEFLQTTEEQFDFTFDLNIRGQYFCAQQAVPYMVARGRELALRCPDTPWRGGSIINMSSVHGLTGAPLYTAYAGTKGAIIAFTRALAVEMCPLRIRVNVIAPGPVEVPRYWANGGVYSREMGNAMVPWGRVGLPEDIGYIAAFLASDAGEWITGQVFAVDGGVSAEQRVPRPLPTRGDCRRTPRKRLGLLRPFARRARSLVAYLAESCSVQPGLDPRARSRQEPRKD